MDQLEINKITSEMVEILTKKNSDYAGTIDNISLTGLNGISVRILDKAVRSHSLINSGKETQIKEEALRDTLLDLANYCLIGIMLLDGTWNKISIKKN